MTTFNRFCVYLDATRVLIGRLDGATSSQIITALSGQGLAGCTLGELLSLARHGNGLADTRRERVEMDTPAFDLAVRYGINIPDFGADDLAAVVAPDNLHGQLVVHDLRQFQADLVEASRRLQLPVDLRSSRFGMDRAENNGFVRVDALRAGMLD